MKRLTPHPLFSVHTMRALSKNVGLIVLLFAAFSVKAQVDITASGGTPAASYTTLKTAFDSINAGVHTGTIAISLTGNTTETASAVLNASDTGAASYTSISIMPSGGVTRTISGSVAAALIDLNGADNIVIDGLNTGGNALIIDNSNTGAADVSTLRLINDASNNQVKNCTISGASTAVTLGTILFSTGVFTGNDNNLIMGCTLEGSGATFPANAITSIGNATAGIENSGNFITQNNISNFFSATLITNGILAGAGNTDWAISRNNFYQTATRTYTTANTHQVISITSGNGHRVDSNTIGYSSSTQTGTYAMTSTVATRWIAIDLSVGTTTASSVQFNTITAISLGTSSNASTANGILCGISVKAGDANIGTLYGNTIGATTGTGAITATPTTTLGSIVGINSATTGTIQIHNNNIGALTSSGTTAAIAGGVFGINVSAVATSISIQYNTIGNATPDNMRAGISGLTTGNTYCAGILAPSSSTLATYSHNTVRNLVAFGSGTGSYVRGIVTSTTAGSTLVKIDSNTVHHLRTNSGLTAETSGLLGAVGVLLGTGINSEAVGNIIHDIAIENTGALETDATGMTIVTTANAQVHRNQIYHIRNSSTSVSATAPGTACGIFIRSGVATAPICVFNNMISLGSGETGNISFVGIIAQHGSTPNPLVDSICNNTITIEGIVSSGAQPSFAFARTDFSTTARTTTIVALNNIFTNKRTGGTGKHFAINNNYGVVTPTATGWGTNASDYNILNATSAATVGAWGNVEKTFADWKTISNCDAHSYTAAPVHYVDSSYDLHLNIGTTPNSIESNALPIATVAYDFDGDIRPGPVGSVNGGGAIPDIGADEFDGVGVDATAPQIIYTALLKTCSTSDRILTATISDLTGVYVTGSLMPRIYYHKSNGGAWVSQPGTLVSGTFTNGTWEFPIFSADMGGLSINDSVYYYVIAQDSGAAIVNIGSLPVGVVATDVNTITTHPTPYNYLIGTDLNGLYTLNSTTSNSSTNFHDLVSLENTLANACVSGPVTVEITTASGPYSGALVISEMPGLSSINTFTLNGNNEVISHSPNTTDRHIIKLNGADYIILKNLHITGLDPVYGWGIHLTNEADHDSILNCTIDLSANTSTTIDNSACIVASASTTDLNSAGNNANYLTVQNCELIGAYQGIIINGSATNNSMHNHISNNIIRDFYSIGTELTHNDSTVYAYNDVHRTNRITVGTFEGIEMGTGNKQLRINANRFHNTHDAATTQSGTAYGIYSTVDDAPVGFENRITNNLIYNFNSGTGTIYAIYNSGSDGAHYYHNTISLDNAAATAGITRGFYQTTAATNIDFRNNIITIRRGGTGIKYCLYLNMNTSTVASDNNDLYMNAPAGTNAIGYYDGAIGSTFADWQLVNSNAFDQQSVAVTPNYTSLALNNYTPRSAHINDMGDSVGVFTDFSGTVRPNTTPDPGALEFTPAAVDAQLNWIAPVAPLAAGNHTVTVNVTNNSLAAAITDIELEYFDGVSVVTETFSSLSIAASTSQPLSFAAQYALTGSVTLKAYIKSVNGSTDGAQTNDTTQRTFCLALAAGSYTIDASQPTGGTNFSSFTDAINQLSCGILGPVVFDVVPGSGPYTEQITIPAIAGSSAVNRITFNGNGDTIEYTPNTSARHIIKLDGADYITLRNLYVKGNAPDFDWGIYLTNEADYDSIVDCTIDLLANTSTTVDNSASIAVAAAPTDINSAGNNANHLTVTGCTMMGGYYGAVINGNALNSQNNNLINNTIRDFYSIGIEYTRMDSCLIEGNDISRANRVTVTTFEGIESGADNKRVHISKNKIHDTHNSATTQSGAAYGIFHSANDAPVGYENIVSNNIIYNFNSTTGTTYGLYNSGSDGVYYYYNTINLSHPGATSGTTYGIYQTSAADNIVIKNNLVSITRGGSGTKNCLRFATTTSSIISNNNLLYMNAPAGTVGVGYYSTNFITLANWQGANSGAYDQQSVSADPLFNSSTVLIPLPTSVAIGNGTPISGITTDIIDTLRNSTTPSIGAYEKTNDLVSPDISLTQLLSVPISTSRTLTGFATITDVSGVDIITNKPRLYYRKTTDDNAYTGNTASDNGWKWTEATNTTSPFNFTIDYSILLGGSVAGGDSIQYFVVAQDLYLNPNLSVSNGTFTIAPDSVDLTAAAFPINGTLPYYRVLPDAAGGTITVGASGNYLNLTAALDYLKQNNFTSDVLVELLFDYDGSTGETFPLSFSEICRADSSIKITIRPEVNVATMLVTSGVPDSDMPLIDLNATHHIYFDGRPGGLGDMTNIKWTIRNKRTAATFSPTIRFINDACNNRLEYLNIQSANTLTTSGTVLFSTTTGTRGNDSNIVQYNIIRDRSDSIGIAANAIYSAGTPGSDNDYNSIEYNELFNFRTSAINISATGNGGNWTLTNNSIYYNNATAPTTAQTGILFAAASNNNTITNNTIGGTAANAGGTAWIHNGNTAFTGISASFDSLSTSVISQNVVRNISKTNTGSGVFTGIIMSRGNALISQNLIGDTVSANSITVAGTSATIGISNTNPLANTLVTIEYNRVANITSSNAGTGAIVRGISYTSGSPYPACNILYNKTFNLSTNSAVAGYAAGSIAAQGIYCFPGGYGPTSEMAYNTVYEIAGTNTSTTAATNVSGITATNFVGSIHHNVIYDIKNHSLDSGALRPTANGMYLRFLDPCTIHNNMISLTNNPSDSVQLNGIMITGANGGTQSYFYNSIHIGNSIGAPVSSFAFHRGENDTSTQSYQPIVMQNNLFINTVSSAGKHYAIGNESSRPDSSWISSSNNYNNFYAVDPNYLTLWGTTSGDLTSWQTLSLGDANSVSKAVTYTNVANADLHLTGSSIGDFDLAGTPLVNYTTDFDGETRNPFRPYMGADELLSSPVPVVLTSFTALAKNKDVIVNWNTASEINALKYVVEASADGIQFKSIGSVKAKGESSTSLNYQLMHFNAQADFNGAPVLYYRLVSIDRDGQKATSKMVKVSFKELASKYAVSIAPNPFNTSLSVSINAIKDENIKVELFDLFGNQVYSQLNTIHEGTTTFDVTNIENLPAGIYFLRTTTENQSQTFKVLKN